MKELLEKPGFLAPSGTLGADVSYLLALVFTMLFLIAWRFAKKTEGTKHHKLILVSMVSMVVYFSIPLMQRSPCQEGESRRKLAASYRVL